MNRVAILYLAFSLAACSSEEPLAYGDLPCSENIDSFIMVVNGATKALGSVDESKLKGEIARISDQFSPISESIEKCVWITHWEKKADYDDLQRETAMKFSSAINYLVATNHTITEKEEITEVEVELARYSYESQSKMLNKANH